MSVFGNNNKTKIAITALAISLVLTISATLISIYAYGESLLNIYTDMAQRIAHCAGIIVENNNDLHKYADVVFRYNHNNATDGEVESFVETRDYQNTFRYLNELRQQMDINGIYVGLIDFDVMKERNIEEGYVNYTWEPLEYIIDVFYDEALRLKFGDKGRLIPKYRDAILECCERMKILEGTVVASGNFGTNITSILPIFKNADYALIVGVEIPMSLLEKNKGVYSALITFAMGVVFFIILMLMLIIILITMVNPATTAINKPWTPPAGLSWTYRYTEPVRRTSSKDEEIRRLEDFHGLNDTYDPDEEDLSADEEITKYDD